MNKNRDSPLHHPLTSDQMNKNRDAQFKRLSFSENTEQRVDPSIEQEINASDVLCGRDKESFNHVGNHRFRAAVAASATKYQNSTSRFQKSLVVTDLIRDIRATGARFMKRDKSTGKWVELGERRTIEKVGHAIRDAVSFNACPEKKRKRRISNFSTTSSTDETLPGKARTSSVDKTYDGDDESRLRSTSSSISDPIQVSKPQHVIAPSKPAEPNHNTAPSKSGKDTNIDDDFISKINQALGPISSHQHEDDPLRKFLDFPK